MIRHAEADSQDAVAENEAGGIFKSKRKGSHGAGLVDSV